jgi:tetratricopeptide (TPR) repeat protein
MAAPRLAAWTTVHPDDALGHAYLGLALGRSGDTTGAVGELRRALELDPGLSRARRRLARVLVATGEEEAAERLLQEGLRIDPGAASLHAELGRLYEGQRQFRPAAAAWQQAAVRATNDAEAWYHAGLCWLSAHEEGQALAAYRRAVALTPRSVPYETALAGVLRVQREYGEAERHCRSALSLAPDDADAQFERARLLWDRDGATPETEASMRRAVALQPASPLRHYSLATVCEERAELDAATQEYESTLGLLAAQEPPPATADWASRETWLAQVEGPHFNLARVLRRRGRADAAAGHLRKFRRISDYRNEVRRLLVRIASRPGDAGLYFELARAHAAAGSPTLAAEQVRAGLRLRPDAGAQAELRALGAS